MEETIYCLYTIIKCELRIYGEGGRFENTPDLLLGWAKNGRVPIQGFFPFGFAQGQNDGGGGWGGGGGWMTTWGDNDVGFGGVCDILKLP